MGGPSKPAGRQTVELRIRLSGDSAKRLSVAAAVRGVSPSELVEWALLPHLAFALPELPDVAVSAIGPGAKKHPPGSGTGGASAA